LKKTQMTLPVRKVLTNILNFLFAILLFACTWRTVGDFNKDSNANWLRSDGVRDSDFQVQLVAAIYWSVVTCSTVGYGDILPTYLWEQLLAIFVFIVVVPLFSTLQGDLSAQFSIILRNSGANDNRVTQLDDLEQKYPDKISQDLIEKMTQYFQKYEGVSEVDMDEINKLVKMLPGNLRIKLLKFRNKKNLEAIPFLHKRSTTFLLTYLEKLKTMHFEKNEVISKKGTKATEVLFCVEGDLINIDTNRILPKGVMIGADDIILHRDRLFTIKALSDITVLRLDLETFRVMMQQNPDVRKELMDEAVARS